MNEPNQSAKDEAGVRLICQHLAIAVTYEHWPKAYQELAHSIAAALAAKDAQIERLQGEFEVGLRIIKEKDAEIERLNSLKDGQVCPCTLSEPCHYACTCANPMMSGGCLRCATYGSNEQKKRMADAIARGELSKDIWDHNLAEKQRLYEINDTLRAELDEAVRLLRQAENAIQKVSQITDETRLGWALKAIEVFLSSHPEKPIAEVIGKEHTVDRKEPKQCQQN